MLPSSSAWRSKKPGLAARKLAMSVSVIPCTPIGVAPWLLLISFGLSQIDLPFENSLGRPGHQHRRAFSGPFDRQPAAAGLDIDLRIEQTEADADRDRSAGASAAGERLAGAALEDAQADG